VAPPHIRIPIYSPPLSSARWSTGSCTAPPTSSPHARNPTSPTNLNLLVAHDAELVGQRDDGRQLVAVAG